MEERELPVGWITTQLGEIIEDIEAGKNLRCNERPPENDEEGIVKVSAVSWGSFREEESKTVLPGTQLDPRAEIKKGDLLFSRANTIELVGACVQVEAISKKLFLSDKILRLVSHDDLKGWIKSYLSSPAARFALSEASSGNQLSMRNISQKALLAIEAPLAPLNEQRRIAAKLDTTFAAVDACCQRLEGVAELLKRFRQAVLEAATTGELTREWREEKTESLDWKPRSLAEICTSIADGDHQAPPKAETGIPFITISAIRDACLDLEKASRFVPASYYNGLSDTRTATPGDILFSVTGTLGVPALVDTSEPFVFQRHIALLRPHAAQVWSRYFYYRMLADDIRRLCYDQATGTAQLRVPLGVLRGIKIQLPSLAEQAEIVSRTEVFFSLADQLEARLNATRQVVERLTPALLAKAFRGELVPQDPADEPASVLLERIRAARQADAAAGTPSRRGRRKAAATLAPSLFDAAPVPPDRLCQLLRECGPLSERALLAASELEPQHFAAQLELEQAAGRIRRVHDNGQDAWEVVA